MIHLTEMRFIISPKINSGKNNIKANRAGYNCTVESALQSKGSQNASPSKGELYYCWCLSGSRMQQGPWWGSLAGAPRVRAWGWLCELQRPGSLLGLLSHCCTGCGCCQGGVDEILPFKKLVWHRQLSAHCCLWSSSAVPAAGVLFSLQCEDQLLSLALRCCRLWQAERVIPEVPPRASLIYLFIFPLTAHPQESYSWCSINNHSRSSRISPSANLLTDSDWWIQLWGFTACLALLLLLLLLFIPLCIQLRCNPLQGD